MTTEQEITVLKTEISRLQLLNKDLLEKCMNIEKNLIRQIETYNQHIANLHVHPIGP